MAEQLKLNHPWLVAVWPGMGNVALNAGVYLLAKLEMHAIAELDAGDLFDVDHVEVKDGIVQPVRRPGNRLFVWTDPNHRHDLVVFLGEAQPPLGKFRFCRQLMLVARELGVERVFTFAAMATRMHPQHRSRLFAVATNQESLAELKRLELEVLEDGNIGGLNGVLLGAVAENGLPGACLLGEMPHILSQFAFPKASLAILEAFTALARIDLNLDELAEQTKLMEQQLGEVLARVEQSEEQPEPLEEETDARAPAEDEGVRSADKQRLEGLFEEAGKDRSKAFELKRELDRLGVFSEYEDRFLDLFKKPD